MRNHLNDSDVSGNTMAWMADNDRENTSSHRDQHKCDCGAICNEHEWHFPSKMCRVCAEDLPKDECLCYPAWGESHPSCHIHKLGGAK